MGRRRKVWRRTLILELQVPEDDEGVWDHARINVEVTKEGELDESDDTFHKSTKVVEWREAVGAVLRDLAVYLQGQTGADEAVKASIDARAHHQRQSPRRQALQP